MYVDNLPHRNIIAIDMKSFFATCECVERGLDPFTTPLVVAEPNRNGAITLAVSPYMKKLGIGGRTRIYEIPSNIKYMTCPPRMNLYVEKSKAVIAIYQEFVAKEDIHIYSIDECFLDVTSYLKMYKETDYDLAKKIMKVIESRLGLIATAGIGPNMLIAKVAMDIEAKHCKDNIAKWTYDDVKNKMWKITPLSSFWGIGKRMEKKLNAMGIFTIGELANYSKEKLQTKFGIMGLELWNHANGIDFSKINSLNSEPKSKSYGHSQVLFKDYNDENIQIIIKEMIEVLTARLRKNKKLANVISFGIGYSKIYGGGFYHSKKIDVSTSSSKEIYKVCQSIFENYYEDLPIRKVSISLGGLIDNNSKQLDIFENYEKSIKNEDILETVDEIKLKFGKNSILKASSLLSDSTMIERNKKIGGHRA